MKRIDQWLEEYGVSHQNPTNKKIHWVCVPSIVFSLIGMLWSIPHAYFESISPLLNWGTIFLALTLIYYLTLSRSIFLGMLLVSLAVGFGNHRLDSLDTPLWLISLVIFTVAWIGQFIGHKIEGKKPSFFQDLQFLLIGPAWCLSFLYDKLRIPYVPGQNQAAPAR